MYGFARPDALATLTPRARRRCIFEAALYSSPSALQLAPDYGVPAHLLAPLVDQASRPYRQHVEHCATCRGDVGQPGPRAVIAAPERHGARLHVLIGRSSAPRPTAPTCSPAFRGAAVIGVSDVRGLHAEFDHRRRIASRPPRSCTMATPSRRWTHLMLSDAAPTSTLLVAAVYRNVIIRGACTSETGGGPPAVAKRSGTCSVTSFAPFSPWRTPTPVPRRSEIFSSLGTASTLRQRPRQQQHGLAAPLDSARRRPRCTPDESPADCKNTLSPLSASSQSASVGSALEEGAPAPEDGAANGLRIAPPPGPNRAALRLVFAVSGETPEASSEPLALRNALDELRERVWLAVNSAARDYAAHHRSVRVELHPRLCHVPHG